jgi:hypothetical protein
MATAPHALRRRVLGMAAASAAALAFPLARAQEPAFSEEARRRMLPGDAAERQHRSSERRALLDEGERHLESGRAAAALAAFESAALMLHAADTELGIVRAQMAAGEYRRSLAFGAHTAGVHRDQPAGSALYVWLLLLGGQTQVARHFLGEALARAPGHPQLSLVEGLLADPWPRAVGSLLQAPWRAAPYAWTDGTPTPAALAVAGSGTLLAQGRTALVSAAVVRSAAGGRLWLRNGLGQTVEARVEAPLAAGVVRVRLDSALAAPAWQASSREPYAGSPGLMAEYAPDGAGTAAWPLLRLGFFAGEPGTTDARPLGLAAPPGPRGGPVFDRNGQLAGVSVGSEGRTGRFVPWQALSPDIELPQPDPAVQLAGLPDVVYEHALRTALQVLVRA